MEESKENSSAPNLNESGRPKRKYCAKRPIFINNKNVSKGTRCPICGQTIKMCNKYNPADYVYKQDNKTFCSWGCMRQWEREHSGKITARIMAEIEAYIDPKEIKAVKDEARIKARLMKKW